MFKASWRQALKAWEKFQKILMIFIGSFVAKVSIVLVMWQNFITFLVNLKFGRSEIGCFGLGQGKRLLLYFWGGTQDFRRVFGRKNLFILAKGRSLVLAITLRLVFLILRANRFDNRGVWMQILEVVPEADTGVIVFDNWDSWVLFSSSVSPTTVLWRMS